MSKVIIGGLVMLFLGPAAGLLSLTAILNPAAEASCLPATSVNFAFFSDDDTTTAHPVGESSRVVFPLPKGTWIQTSEFGMPRHPTTGISTLHSGTDLGHPSGNPTLAPDRKS